MTRYTITGCHITNLAHWGCDRDNVFRTYLTTQRRPVIDCNPNGKWRIGDTIGTVPKGHDCVIEGFVVRKGRTVRRGKVTHVPNGTKDIHYILRGNDVA